MSKRKQGKLSDSPALEQALIDAVYEGVTNPGRFKLTEEGGRKIFSFRIDVVIEPSGEMQAEVVAFAEESDDEAAEESEHVGVRWRH
jgi:hypothetical protein